MSPAATAWRHGSKLRRVIRGQLRGRAATDFVAVLGDAIADLGVLERVFIAAWDLAVLPADRPGES